MQVVLVTVAAVWGASFLVAGFAGAMCLLSPRLRREVVGI